MSHEKHRQSHLGLKKKSGIHYGTAIQNVNDRECKASHTSAGGRKQSHKARKCNKSQGVFSETFDNDKKVQNLRKGFEENYRHRYTHQK